MIPTKRRYHKRIRTECKQQPRDLYSDVVVYLYRHDLKSSINPRSQNSTCKKTHVLADEDDPRSLIILIILFRMRGRLHSDIRLVLFDTKPFILG